MTDVKRFVLRFINDVDINPLMFEEQQRIRYRSMTWVINKAQDLGPVHHLVIEGVEESNKGMKLNVIYRPGLEDIELLGKNDMEFSDNLAPFSLWSAFMESIQLSLARREDILTSLLSSRIKIEPYQFVPLIRSLSNIPPRILIADDVGLGKTVEAGIIHQELASRNLANRVLIMVPASLQDQWQDEMRSKFGEDFEIFSSNRIREIYKDMMTGDNPWKRYNKVITSIDYIKRPEIRKQLNDVYWDLTIIDEAHYLASPKTDRGRLGKFISDRSNSLVLLTATPHNGNDESFLSLLKVLDPYLSEDALNDKNILQRYIVRRLKKDVFKDYEVPEVESMKVSFSDSLEEKIYQITEDYTDGVWKRSQKGKKGKINYAAAFAMVVLKKRMMSSYYALQRSLENRVKSLIKLLDEREEIDENYVVKEDLKKRYIEEVSLTERQKENAEKEFLKGTVARNKKELRKEIEEVQSILETAKRLNMENGDSKSRKLVALLDELNVKGGNKAIIFTEYRDTQDFLVDFLTHNGYEDKIVVMNGILTQQQRAEAEKQFQSDDKLLLVATDSASEGLNFQERCHIVINYELPWNPNRLLQRIGRVDRYGQKKEVIVKNLYFGDTYEGDILAKLVEKITLIIKRVGSATDVLGMWDSQEMVADIMEKKETLMTLDDYIDNLEETQKSKIAKLYEFLSDCEEEGKVAEEYIGRTGNPENLRKMVETTIKRLGGSMEDMGDGLVEVKIPPKKLSLEETEFVGTFNREMAIENEKIEFFSMKHPLLQEIARYYRSTLYNPIAQNRITYVRREGGEEGVVFYFYVKYVDGKDRTISEELIPVFVPLDGSRAELMYDVPEDVRAANIPADIHKTVKDKWGMLFKSANEKGNEGAEKRIEEIKPTLEEKISIVWKTREKYYKKAIARIEEEINRKKAQLGIQLTLEGEEESSVNEESERRLRREIGRLNVRKEKLQREFDTLSEEKDSMTQIRIADRKTIGAIILGVIQ